MQRQAVEESAAIGEQFLDTVREEPEIALAVAIGLLAVILGGAIWRYLHKTPGDRFASALAQRDLVTVLMHPNPDPDAMASAMAVSALADSVDTESVIQYPGQIRHPENRAFETVLDCEFSRIEQLDDIAAEAVVLVDHNRPRGFDGALNLDPYAVVDHHPGNGDGEAFTDVRSERGSCASILTDYLRERDWSNDSDDDGWVVTPSLATGLLYGIRSDTTSFSRGCTDEEFDAAAYLFPAADPDSLERIASPQVDSETLSVKAKAITERRTDGSFLVSHVGSTSNLDALPMAAEELVRLEGITVAVITGERDGTIHLSGRSRDDRVHMGKTLEAAMDAVYNCNDADSECSAGGHARMGGGQAPLPSSAAGWGEHPELEAKLFAAMNGEL